MTNYYVSSSLLATKLIRLQIGREASGAWGTAVAASNIWHGVSPVPTFKPKVKSTLFEEQKGTIVPNYIQARTEVGGEWDLKGIATYEDILFLLGMALKGDVTPTGGPAYIWSYPAPIAQAWSALSMTMELGMLASSAANQAAGCLLDTWQISSEQGKEWMFTCKGFFKEFKPGLTALTSSVPASDYTVEPILMPMTDVYLSPVGSATGTSASQMENASYKQTGTLIKFQLDGKTGLGPVYAGGAYSPVNFTYQKPTATLTLGLLYTSGVQSWIQTLLGTATNTNIAGGAVCGNAALLATSSTHNALIEFSGCLADDPKYWEDSQGAQVVSLKLSGVYDSAGLANYLSAKITNGIASLT